MSKSYYTDNQWQTGEGILFSSQNPATGSLVWQGRAASSTQISQSVNKGNQAFLKWSKLSIEERIGHLQKYGDALQESIQGLAISISEETGKPLWDSAAEVKSMVNKIAISLEAYKNRCATLTSLVAGNQSITRHKAHGLFAVFGPYNFPGHLPNGHIVPALLAGNTILFKPSEWTPAFSIAMMECFQKAEFPSNVIQMLPGGIDVGINLYKEKEIAGVLFTGSVKTGNILAQYFGNHPSKILALEMGGNNPLIIDEIEDVEAAVYLTIQSAFLSSGQRCTCARRLIVVDSPQSNEYLKQLVKMIESLKIGPYTDIPEPFMGPIISENHALQFVSIQNDLRAQGAIPLSEMKFLKKGTGFLTPGLIDVTLLKNRPDTEIFGPLLQLIRVRDLKEAIKEANNTQFGLSAGIVTIHAAHYQEVLENVEAGVINWNTPLTGASSSAPFGGIKSSGNGRPSAYYAADFCAYPVASMESAHLKLPSTLLPGISKIHV